jgi:thioredoxin:protein disulfide reductase
MYQCTKKQVTINCLLLLMFTTANAENFLPAHEAFKISAKGSHQKIEIQYDVAPNYYLYQTKLKFESAKAGDNLGKPQLPKSITHFDQNFQKNFEIYRHKFTVIVPTTGQPSAIKLSYQGCADAGLCYTPQTTTLPISWQK